MTDNNTQQFMNIFKGYSKAYGKFTITSTEENGKKKGFAKTVKEPPTEDLYKKHLMGTSAMGIVMLDDDEKVSFAAIDIDENDIDHHALDDLRQTKNFPLGSGLIDYGLTRC